MLISGVMVHRLDIRDERVQMYWTLRECDIEKQKELKTEKRLTWTRKKQEIHDPTLEWTQTGLLT